MKPVPLLRSLVPIFSVAVLASCSGSQWNNSLGPSRKHVDSTREDTTLGQDAATRAAAALMESLGLEPGAPFLERAWKVQAPGLIGDLSVSSAGDLVVASTIVDTERPSSGDNGRHLVTWDSSGAVKFRSPLGSQTRVQDLSPDGETLWIASYDGDFQAWDVRKGRRLWSLARSCRPVGLADGVALCVRDDEARPPETLFEAIDARGRVFFAQSRADSGEVLAVKRAPGGKYFALLLSGGGIRIFKAGTFQQQGERVPFVREVAKFKSEGEPLDLGFGMPGDSEDETAFFVSILSIDAGGRPWVEVVDSLGLRVGGAMLDRPALQVGCTNSCRNIVLYGNGLAGQWIGGVPLAGVRRSDGGAGELPPVRWKWLRRLSRSADYSSRLEVPPRLAGWRLPIDGEGDEALVGFEWSDGLERRSFMVAFSASEGKVRWLVPIDSGEGAYLYAFGAIQGSDANGARLVIATDDGWLRGFTPRR